MKLLFAVIALGAFNFSVAQKTVELKKFSSLTIGSDMEVTLIKSDQDKFVIEDGDEEEINIYNQNGSLILNGDGSAVLYYANDIENIVLSSDSVLECKDEFKVNKLSITAASDAELNLRVDVKTLELSANSDAEVTLKGKADYLTADVNSDAEVNAKGLTVKNADIVLSSDAVAEITVTKRVNATVSSDADLKIYGNPKEVNKKVGDEGSITIVR